MYSDMELILEKIDQEYKAGKSHGAGSLEGAEFTVCYYAGIYDQATLPKTPDRTWVLKSKKEKDSYESRLNKDYQISGDDFYYAKMERFRYFRLERSVLKRQKHRKDIHWTERIYKV